jgi:hypothetical protein
VGAILLVKFISKNALITSNTQNEFYFFASKSETHINTDLTGLIQCTPFGLVGVSTPAGGIQDYTIPINVPNGYKFVGVLDVTISGGASVTLVSANAADSSNAIVRTRNNGTTAVTPSGISIRALLVKTIATV